MFKIKITKPFRFFVIGLVGLAVVAVVVFNILWGSPIIAVDGEFTIADGSSADKVWTDLVELNYFENVLPLYYYSWRLEASNDLKSGSYDMTKGEHVRSLIARFVSGDSSSEELSITYPEGFTLEQIAARTASTGIGTAATFKADAQPSNYVSQFPILKGIPAQRDLEGYLFPDTYRVFVDDEPKDVIQRMLTVFNGKFSQELRDEAVAQGRTLDQIVIMASIIEREVISDEDMGMVAGVLWKRFDEGIGLAADATVRYALGKWNKPLTVNDLDIDSPYNTRKWRGLPPGPISNPGVRSIQAAVRPAASQNYYYLSTPEGKTIFSKTLDEHNTNKYKYLR
jgi:UPF0755 protein